MAEDNLPEFIDDPTENLRIENEILKLKMQAENGAVFGGEGNLPPEMENIFLQDIQQFEQHWENVKYVKVYELLGKPQFIKEGDLSDIQLTPEFEKMLNLLDRHNINLHFSSEYPDRLIYRFITEELFEHETDDVQIPGMRKNFDYEEFHPNHNNDIRNRAEEFFRQWFSQRLNEHSWELCDPFILSAGNILPKSKVLDKVNKVYQSYPSFCNTDYSFSDISFELNEEDATGLGHAEGHVQYDAVLENGEIQHFAGPFKLYLSCDLQWWSIFYFVFPGFNWQDEM